MSADSSPSSSLLPSLDATDRAPDALAPADATPAVAEPTAQDSTDPIHHNSSESIIDSSIPLPTFTPGRPQPDLPPKQLAALSLLTSGKSISAAASMLGLHRTTIQLWKRNPAFAAELESRRAELRDAIDSRLYRLLLHATHACIASLKVNDLNQSHRNAFRLMSTLRPWMPRIDALLDRPPKEYADNNRAPKLAGAGEEQPR